MVTTKPDCGSALLTEMYGDDMISLAKVALIDLLGILPNEEGQPNPRRTSVKSIKQSLIDWSTGNHA